MRKRKGCKQWVLALAGLLAIAGIPMEPVQAGLSRTEISTASCVEEMDEGVWSNPDGDVIGTNGVISFPKDSTDASRIISRTTLAFSQYVDVLLDAEFTLDFVTLPKDKQFIFAIGIQSLEGMPGDSGNVELRFSNNGGLKAEVVACGADEDAIQIAKSTACGNVRSGVKVKVQLSSNQNLKVVVGGKTVCNATLPSKAEGNVGFLQTGSCEVKVKGMKCTFYRYDRPENTNLEEDFEEGIFNSNLLFSRMLTGSKMNVEEFNGSNVFMFKDAKIGYIGTKHMYSNFELTFDVVYNQNKDLLDENGQVILAKTWAMGVSFGGDAVEYQGQDYTKATDLIVFSGNRAYSHNTEEEFSGTPVEHLYADGDCDRPYNLRISVIDGVITVGVRWLHETKYEDYLTYTLDDVSPGYVHIWSPSGFSSSFAIDNIKLTNKDKDANLIDVEYQSAKIDIPEDFHYEPQGMVYKPTEVVEEETGSNYWIIAVVAGGCALALGFTVGVVSVKNRKKKEGAQ